MRRFTFVLFLFLLVSGISAQTSVSFQIRELLTEARSLAGQQKFDEAAAKCREAMALDPKYVGPYFALGEISYIQMKFSESSEWFAKAIALSPDDKVLFVYKADADLNRKAFDEAVHACRSAIKIDPDFAQAYLLLGDTLRLGEMDLDEAAAAYRNALRLAPQYHDLVSRSGDYFSGKKSYKNAEEVYRGAMAADPDKMSGRFSLGRMLLKLDRIKEARDLWEGRTRDEGEVFPKFETLLLRAERLEAAKKAIAKTPDDAGALVELGEAVLDGDSWVVDGRQEKAIALFRQALKIQPGFVAAQKGIVKAYIELANISAGFQVNVETELAELKRLDPAQALKMEEYRASFKVPTVVVKPKKKQ